MTPFVRAYIDMAVGSELDRRAVLDDISPATLRQMTLDANEFYRDNRTALGRSLRPSELDTIALDFWNARNGHGAGFIGSEDRFGEGGGSLAAAARRFGKYELREGDDGRIYGRSVRPARRSPKARRRPVKRRTSK